MLHNNSANALGAESMVGENETSMAIWEPQKNPIMKCLMVKVFDTTHYFFALQVTYIYFHSHKAQIGKSWLRH